MSFARSPSVLVALSALALSGCQWAALRRDFPNEGSLVPEDHSFWVDTGGEVAEVQFGCFEDMSGYPQPLGRVLFYGADGVLRRRSPIDKGGFDRNGPLQLVFENSAAGRHAGDSTATLLLGWEATDDGALLLRWRAPFAACRFAGPRPTPEPRQELLPTPQWDPERRVQVESIPADHAVRLLDLPEDVEWRTTP